MAKKNPEICAVDVFCGIGGLSYGLKKSGVEILAGIDVDPDCQYAFERNIGAPFIEKDINVVKGREIKALYPPGCISLLAGCAPCTPFSSMGNAKRAKSHRMEWALLDQFTRLVREVTPDLVSMENVARVKSKAPFLRFLKTLSDLGYDVDWRSVNCLALGLPQTRRRLVLIASRIGPIAVPCGKLSSREYRTVKETIGNLPPIQAGASHKRDSLHTARKLEKINIERMKYSKPGGTWLDWPKRLRAPCHRKRTGQSFLSVYARMRWNAPSPTITTLFYNFGTGRFGHPKQHRAISMREAAMLQGFPRNYEFIPPGFEPSFSAVGRMIGNAVPPTLGKAIGAAMLEAIAA
ncbi:MAG TPA: DNA cytosine methyltransferase [Burkholderiales bacterium]|nr:DNA cytosine methyltransferase [Burkholderiales bacterium]